ncbi:antitoxin AF2212-like protein [Thermococcus barophilus]|uniref:antitoxin AF2212-like protein n=1 Tax=Thermococcus barophilus TaxID=55802 RepID=UPI0009E9EBB9|nr:antitoxin AF2212-like protein [Thermococcus barophilus]
MESIEVVYENGVLKPLKKLNLKEGEKLRIKIIANNIADFIRSFEKEIERPQKDPLKILQDMREQR